MPFESTRVCLQPIRGVEGSDYINASCIDGYRSVKDFIFKIWAAVNLNSWSCACCKRRVWCYCVFLSTNPNQLSTTHPLTSLQILQCLWLTFPSLFVPTAKANCIKTKCNVSNITLRKTNKIKWRIYGVIYSDTVGIPKYKQHQVIEEFPTLSLKCPYECFPKFTTIICTSPSLFIICRQAVCRLSLLVHTASLDSPVWVRHIRAT